ncbi:MAG: efflux RND transporter periplasmic adaptor subunit [Candidatus Latescibacteria bacterium]|nr:efflux RND transporter periplasmic adaptor subunit [Candidatus Latescibacterota bacterium]
MATTLSAPSLRPWRQLEITYLVPEGSTVEEDEVVVRFDPKTFENDYRIAYNALAVARADANRKQAERKAQQFILEANRQSAAVTLAASRNQLAKLEFIAPRLSEIRRLELKRDELLARKISRKLASIAVIQEEERNHTDILIEQAKHKLKEAQETIEKLNVKASTEGFVIYDRGWRAVKPREGSAKYPGEAVARISDLSAMRVKLQVGEIQSQRLREGQHAEVVVSSLSGEPVTGKVARVARRATPTKAGSSIKQVQVIVELDSTMAGYTSGLSAHVRIFVKKVREALVAPIDCVFDQDSLYVVYVREGTRFVPRRVNLTARNADFAVIEGDLESGSEIALHPPAH